MDQDPTIWDVFKSVHGLEAIIIGMIIAIVVEICYSPSKREGCIKLCSSGRSSSEQVSYADKAKCYRECMEVDE